MEEKKLRRRPAKYNNAIVEQICELVRADTYTQREMCMHVGLDETTFGRWKKRYPEFEERLKQAEADRMSKLVVEARRSLMKRVTGYDVKEHSTKTVPGKEKDKSTGKQIPIVKEQINKTRHVDPDTTAIIFVLTNGDPEHFKNRHTQEITGVGGSDLFKGKSDEDLERAIEAYKYKLNMADKGED